MTPDATTPNPQSAKPSAQSAATVARKRQTPAIRFPARFHMAISIPMAESLQRLTGSNSLLAEADIGRLALHGYLLANDPLYRREIGGSHGRQ